MFGCPVILNVLPGTGIETRNAVPVPFWQSVQWQICVFSGSASPSMMMAPHEHPPSIFIGPSLSVSHNLGSCQAVVPGQLAAARRHHVVRDEDQCRNERDKYQHLGRRARRKGEERFITGEQRQYERQRK